MATSFDNQDEKDKTLSCEFLGFSVSASPQMQCISAAKLTLHGWMVG